MRQNSRGCLGCQIDDWTLRVCAAGRLFRRQPSQRVSLQGERHTYTFDQEETDWDTFTVPGKLALFEVNNGALKGAVTGDRGCIWSLPDAYYLAFFANGQFLAEARDNTLRGSSLAVVLGATSQTAWVEFDTIRINDAALAGPR